MSESEALSMEMLQEEPEQYVEQVTGPSSRRIRRAELAVDPHFPPVANGLDYLVSVVENLEVGADRVTARNLKYAVLHLAAGAEVLLKARLQMEHWSLVFAQPGHATLQALEDGSLSSCSPEETRQRLTNIVGITFKKREKDALLALAQSRNALQHYGLMGERANAKTVESTTAQVLNFLIRFIDEHLLPLINDEEERRNALTDLERIRDGLHLIQGYVDERMRDLRPALGPVRACTVQCPECRQWAFVAGDDWVKARAGDPPARIDDVYSVCCRFCEATMNPEEAAHMYSWAVLGREWTADDDSGVPSRCPVCREDVLVLGACTAADQAASVDFCFGCASVRTDLQQCQRCGAVQPAEEEHRCPFGRRSAAAVAARGRTW
ncbi:serine/arginine repetitive matrix protein 1 [Streptomyces antimicrobicus]|uniref:Serine/arginine repetitive matrix protein 1 n=1 Tax=Streptomyces antimicrobicus TaxID=2883108 RepID=A0ABS8B0X0_9ACTN|nr:serine/arginine repetitive matrix protein 1 [Streptomyces antimicrobicus]MCB5178258.1 serine/arginine repetitive matrix protein 1 [Streptomyces antimicrobicus]